MPRGALVHDEARNQRVFLAGEGLGAIVQPVVLYRRESLGFSGGTTLITFPGVVVGKYYCVRYRSFATSASGIRVANGSERMFLDTVVGTRGLVYSVSICASSTSLALEADGAGYTGVLTDVVLYEIAAPVSLSQPNMLLYPEYHSRYSTAFVSGGRLYPTSAAALLTFPTTMVPGNNYTVSFRTIKTAGSEIRVSNNAQDGTSIVFTTSGLPAGETLTTTSSFTAGSRMITLGASGGNFTGQVWEVTVN
jgi:hypothetical protein